MARDPFASMHAVDHDQLLAAACAELDEQFDPDRCLLESPFTGGPGYHTTLDPDEVETVHQTRESLGYALALLDVGGDGRLDRATEIIDTVLDHQDLDETNDTYGIWPWYTEEPLTEMAPPDWNWADFCGKRLLLIARRHGDRLPADLCNRIETAVLAASDAIVERDVGPGYTNIAIMGAFVTIIAGETYDRPDLHEYGIERFERFDAHVSRYDAFDEYNSPTYTRVAIVELGSLATETATPAVETRADRLLERAWTMAATHYHVPTGEWAGPHARSYRTMLSDGIRSFLEVGTNRTIDRIDPEVIEYDPLWYATDFSCPPTLRSLFAEHATRGIDDHYGDAADRPLTARTYLTDTYAIGTFDRSSCWNQRRAVVGYAASADGAVAIRVRMLKDGYDLAAAQTTAAQCHNRALVGFNIATDGGDTHISLDGIDGSLDCADLRVRLELEGATTAVLLPTATEAAVGNRYSIELGETTVSCLVPAARFAGREITTSVVREQDVEAVDYVLYEGEKRQFELDDIGEAALGLAIAFDEDAAATATWYTDHLRLDADDLGVRIPAAPAPAAYLREHNRATMPPHDA